MPETEFYETFRDLNDRTHDEKQPPELLIKIFSQTWNLKERPA
jgi:hypothetical protein